LVWEEAENRKYTVMAVFEALMTKKVEVWVKRTGFVQDLVSWTSIVFISTFK
jgi:hypothetical protein